MLRRVATASLFLLVWTSFASQRENTVDYDKPAAVGPGAQGQVSLFYGGYSHSIPISVPAYRGVEPKISISYNSNGGNGLVGLGWDIDGFLTVEKKPKSQDKFYLGGQLFEPCEGGDCAYLRGNYKSRTPSYQRVTKSGVGASSTWTVQSQAGGTMAFRNLGYDRWGVDTVSDADGNTVTYHWNGLYPDRVTYGPNNYAEVLFVWDPNPRPDAFSRASSEGLYTFSKRLLEIRVSLGGYRQRSYEFGYETSAKSGKSRLKTVTLHGKNVISTLPPITFSYQEYLGATRTTTLYPANPNGVSPPYQVVTGDFVSGDGLPDGVRELRIVQPQPNYVPLAGKFNSNPNAFDEVQFQQISTGCTQMNPNWGDMPLIGELSSDGTPETDGDDVQEHRNVCVYRECTHPDPPFLPVCSNWPTIVGDFGQTGQDSMTSLTSADAPNADWSGTGDFNGDGHTDWFSWETGGQVTVGLSTGSAANPFYRVSSAIFAPTGELTLHAADINGDGLTDLVGIDRVGSCSDPNCTYTVYRYDYVSKGDGSFVLPTGGGTSLGGYFADFKVQMSDFTGDGIADVGILEHESFNPVLSVNSSALGYERLTYAKNFLGGTVSVDYDITAVGPTRTTTVKTLTEDPRVIPGVDAATTTYIFSQGGFDRLRRESLGFGEVHEVAPNVAGETVGPCTKHFFNQDIENLGQEDETQLLAGGCAGTLKRKVIRQFSQNLETQVDSYVYEPDMPSGRHSAMTRHFPTDSADPIFGLGLADQETNWGFDSSGDEILTVYDYVPNDADFLVGLPARTRLYSGTAIVSNNKLTEARFYYDGNSSWQSSPIRGNVTKQDRWLKNPITLAQTYPYKTFEYDPNNNYSLKKTIDETNAPTQFFYDDAFGVSLKKTINALSQVTSEVQSFDLNCGAPTEILDSNRQLTTILYDEFCRVKEVQKSLGAITTFYYNITGRADDTNVRTGQSVSVVTPAADSTTGLLWSTSYLDGFGRTHLALAKGPVSVGGDPAADDTIAQETGFDVRGNVKQASIPRSWSDHNPKWMTTTFDALNRPLVTTHPDTHTITYEYGNNWSKTNDELGHFATQTFDAYGRVKSRDQEGAVTQYGYNGRGELTSVTDAMNNVDTFVYDTFGRKVQANTRDRGIWTFEYDAVGRLKKQTDAMNQITQITYDDLGRLKTKVTPTGTVTFTYDEDRTGFFNQGQLTSTTDPAGEHKMNYDELGRITMEVRVVDGIAYPFEKTYDAGGRLLTAHFPDGDSIGPLVYDGTGKLKSIPGILDSAEYDPTGALTVTRNSNGTQTTRTHDPNRSWLTGIQTTRGAQTLQNLVYTINPEGEVDQVTSPNPNEGWDFDYDSRHQLNYAHSLTSGGPREDFRYDLNGNLSRLNASGNPLYVYPPQGSTRPEDARPHAVTSDGVNSYHYDANGNLRSGAGRTIDYDADNRPLRIQDANSASDTTFVYGADGNRAKKITNGQVTVYLGEQTEVCGCSMTKYISLGSIPIAKRVGQETSWLHTDRSGSVQAVTDQTGAEIQRHKYGAFGQLLSSSSTTHVEAKRFNAQRQDESGLLYLHARYYDPVLARFISPDPLISMDHPAGANAYQYANNNPVSNTDSTGLAAKKPRNGDEIASAIEKAFSDSLDSRGYGTHRGSSETITDQNRNLKPTDCLGHVCEVFRKAIGDLAADIREEIYARWDDKVTTRKRVDKNGRVVLKRSAEGLIDVLEEMKLGKVYWLVHTDSTGRPIDSDAAYILRTSKKGHYTTSESDIPITLITTQADSFNLKSLPTGSLQVFSFNFGGTQAVHSGVGGNGMCHESHTYGNWTWSTERGSFSADSVVRTSSILMWNRSQ